jgi:alpha-tubulin suppressor-like RCC1 family protein
LQLNIEDISYYCLYNSRFNNIICNNNWFWEQKFLLDFGNPDYDHVEDWKSLYKNYGSVYVFGSNSSGQLGLGYGVGSAHITKLLNFKFKVVSAGSAHTVAIDFNNDVYVFGSNNYGQLGLGDEKKRLIPTKLPYFKFKAVYTGSSHTVAIDFNDDIWCFGANRYGQLGLDDTEDRVTPTKLHDLKAKSISTNANRTIVIDLTDSMWVNFALTLSYSLGYLVLMVMVN